MSVGTLNSDLAASCNMRSELCAIGAYASPPIVGKLSSTGPHICNRFLAVSTDVCALRQAERSCRIKACQSLEFFVPGWHILLQASC